MLCTAPPDRSICIFHTGYVLELLQEPAFRTMCSNLPLLLFSGIRKRCNAASFRSCPPSVPSPSGTAAPDPFLCPKVLSPSGNVLLVLPFLWTAAIPISLCIRRFLFRDKSLCFCILPDLCICQNTKHTPASPAYRPLLSSISHVSHPMSQIHQSLYL